MEAVPRLPMVSFSLKTSPDRPPVEFAKLKQYIRDFYNEDPETYTNEIHNLDGLRASAVRPLKDVRRCSVLKKYFCQLHFLQSRFPMAREGAAAIEFTWKDTYRGTTTTSADVKAEMVAVLYNIGALHSQLGAGDDRSTPDGLKMACTHFQCAAWAFQNLKDSYPQPPGTDLSPDMMQFKYHFCLAQAQECILEKSMTDNRKATINAKVAVQIVDYYNLALNILLPPDSLSDSSILDIVGSKNFKSWKKYIRFKIAYYSCISLLYQGMQSEEQQKMGERVAFYQGALDKLNEAIKLSKGIDKAEAVMESLVFTRDVVEGKRKAAKNENEFIYHEEIPDLDSLPNVKGASLVKGIAFNVNDPEISGPDIFSRLVPMKAHEASSLYSEEKAKLLRKMSALVDSKDEEVVSFMSCLQLEYLKSHTESTGLPQEVLDRCAALSSMPDAIPNLVSAMEKLNEAYHDVDGMLKEIMDLIKIEETAEKEYQEIMGSRPPSIVATDLTREANKYMEAHKKAAESNETLHRAMTQHIENLRALLQPVSEIQANLPNLSSLNLHEDKTLNEVTMLVNKVSEMRRQRAMLASQLRESICSDDITALLVTRTNEKLEDIFAKEMQKHEKYANLIEQNLVAQDNILRALTEAYANYAPTRKATAEIMRQRDMMLSALISSYDAYEDLIAKSSKGQEFYRKLETNLTKLLQRVKGTCKVQQEERESILAQNVSKAKKMVEAVSEDSGTGLKLKDYLNKKVSAPPSTYYPTEATSWGPGVRPAPVGSEGTTPVCTSKQPDYNQQPSYSAYTPTNYQNYCDPSTYTAYYNSLYSQNPGLSNLQYPTVSDTSLPTYDANYAASYQPQKGYTTASGQPPVSQAAPQSATNATSYPAQYPTYGAYSYNYSQWNKKTGEQAQPYWPKPGETQPGSATYWPTNAADNNWSAKTGDTQQPSAANAAYWPAQTGETQQPSAANAAYWPAKTGETQQPSAANAAYWPAKTGETQQPSAANAAYWPAKTGETQQPSAANAAYWPAKTGETQQPSAANAAYWPAKTGETQQPTSAPSTNYWPQKTGETTTSAASSYWSQNAGVAPSSTVDSSYNYQQYYYNASNPNYTQGYSYSNTFPQMQFQTTPGTPSSSHYSEAGKGEMSSTMSQGAQDIPVQSPVTPNYYVQPYGSPYSELPNAQLVKQNSMTYMQASQPSNLTMTYSQKPESSSNVDLLAGLDFNVTDAPLQPQSVDKSAESAVSDKIASLTILPASTSSSEESVKSTTQLDPKTEKPADPVERPSPSKTPSKDPFSDPETLSLFVQEVEKFDKFVEGLNCKTLNGPTPLDLKWNELQDLQEKDSHRLIISVARCYPMKNRFADILPYDGSRIELPSTKDDYINASLIQGLSSGCPSFVMTQAPLPSTYADFWTMVLEQHVELIVCLVSEAQMNGEIYYSSSKTEDLILGKIKVSLQSCNLRSQWNERILSVTDGKTSRVVVHLEFTSWPNSWLPESPGPFLALLGEMYSVWGQQRGKGPVVVHCDAGVGRSGVFVLTALVLSELKTSPHLPDLIHLAAKLGQYRKNPLRDRQHLQFTYQCLLYYAQDLLMKRGILASRASFDEKRPKTKTHTRHPSEDFILNSLKEPQERRQSDASSTSSKVTETDPLSQIDPLWPIKRYS